MSTEIVLGKGMRSAIQAVVWAEDLSAIARRLVAGGMAGELAEFAVYRYRQFCLMVALAGAGRAAVLIPTKAIDAALHAHMLDQESFEAFWHRAAGFVPDHLHAGHLDPHVHLERFLGTARIFEEVFDQPYSDEQLSDAPEISDNQPRSKPPCAACAVCTNASCRNSGIQKVSVK